MIWEPRSDQQQEAVCLVERRLDDLSQGWACVFSAPGIRIFATDLRTHSLRAQVLPAGAGVLLGTVFNGFATTDRDTTPGLAQFDEHETRRIVATEGRSLVSRYWGNYVAFLVNHVSKDKFVIKDPCGSLPCFLTEFSGARIFFSCIQDCLALRLVKFTVNWAYVRERVATGDWDFEARALNEVSQVFRGQCFAYDAIGELRGKRTYWSPISFVDPAMQLDQPEHASELVRRVLRACTRAWVSLHKSILLRLSGGLDSSIILSCLVSAIERPRITCATYYNPRSLSDERQWARKAIEPYCHQCEHVEAIIDPAQLDLSVVQTLQPSVEPELSFSYVGRSPLERELGATRSATAIFSGDGGDSLYGESLEFVVTDYLRHRGLTGRVLSLASRVALRSDTTTWSVLGTAARHVTGRATAGFQRPDIATDRKLVSQTVTDEVQKKARSRPYAHPWFSSLSHVPWSTIQRLGILLVTPEFYDSSLQRGGFEMEPVAPILSQPFVELCLRIPSFIHFDSGRDRGLARRAFAPDVPPDILRRQWKDCAPRTGEDLLPPNREFLLGYLLDGILVREGILNKDLVEDVIRGKISRQSYFPAEIIMHTNVEAWLRHWSPPRLALTS